MTKNVRNLLLLCVGTLLLSASLYAAGAIRLNTNLQAGDQGAYLHLSLAQKSGIKLTDGNRHPLYSALLIPFAKRTPDFFSMARWFSFLVGILFLATVAWNEFRRRNDPTTALLSLVFLSLHLQVVRTLSEIWCEPLLYFLVYSLWWNLDRAGTSDGDGLTTTRFTILGGVMTGLVYLCKGTGLQVAALFWVTVFVFAKNKMTPILGVCLFVIISSPLLIWNTVTYQNPIYSFASTHNMWFDEADEIWYDDPEDLPTLGSYLETHSTGEIVGRLVRGLGLESKMALQLLWTDWRLPEGSAETAIFLLLCFKVLFLGGIVLSVVAYLRGRVGRRDSIGSKPGWTFFLLMLMFMFPAFGWYAQLTDAPRFLMTLIPIAVILIARFVSRWAQHWFVASDRMVSLMSVTAMLVVTLFCLVQTSSFFLKVRVIPPPSLDPLAERIIEEVNDLPNSSKIAFGPSHGLPIWMSRPDLVWRPTPWRIDLDHFNKMLEREDIDHVLLDGETLARRPYLSPLAGPTASDEYGWPILARFRSDSGFFILYEIPQ